MNQTEKDRIHLLKESCKALATLTQTENWEAALIVASAIQTDLEKLAAAERGEKALVATSDPFVTAFLTLGRSISRFFWESQLGARLAPYRTRLLVGLGVCAVLLACGYGAFRKIYLQRHGLLGEYYRSRNFDGLAMTRRDNEVNFSWRNVGPAGLSTDYSVRWTGFLLVKETNDYEIGTESDDGVRVWMDDQLIIDNWTEHSPTFNAGKVHLEAGAHPIKLEFFQGMGSSMIRLQWKVQTGNEHRIIRWNHLVPSRRDLRKS